MGRSGRVWVLSICCVSQVTTQLVTLIFQLHDLVQFTPWVERTILSCCQRGRYPFPHAVFVAELAMTVGERLTSAGEIGQALEKMAHGCPFFRYFRPVPTYASRDGLLILDWQPARPVG